MTRFPPPKDSAGSIGPDPTRDAEWEALARYVTGESSPEETEAISRRLSSQPEDEALLSRLGQVTEQLAKAHAPALPVSDADTERALRAVKSKLAGERSSAQEHDVAKQPLRVIPIRPTPARVGRSWRRTALAAAAVAVAAVGLQFWRTRVQHRTDSSAARGTSRAITEFATRVGERDSIRLADGTRVLLGPGSRLSIPAGYGGTHREVELRGEAYIEAVHDAQHPFVVRAGTATIRDVGTKFSVHGDDNAVVRVVVTEGAVSLRPSAAVRDSGTLLRAGDIGMLAVDGTVVAERGKATEDDLAWTRGHLVFRDASMAEVRSDLRRWYGIELVFADSTLITRHFSNAFVDDSPARVLQVIGMTLGVPVFTRGDTSVIGAAPEATRRR